jgi:hypothetical protein
MGRPSKSVRLVVLSAALLASLAGAAAWMASSRGASNSARVSDGTLRMTAWLRVRQEAARREPVLAAGDTSAARQFANRPESIPVLEQAVASASMLGDHINLRFRLGLELIWCGRNAQAARRFEEILQTSTEQSRFIAPEQAASMQSTARNHLAIAHFHTAEEDNCVCGHNADSCLFPIDGGGVHSKPAGSRKAIEVLTESLKQDPHDLGSIWLLNLAQMTLGEHPEKVPPQWLIPRSVFASERDIGRFRDVAAQRGLDRFGLAGGCALEDFDGDDQLDIVVTGWSLDEQVRYFRNRGKGFFEDRTEAAGLIGEVGGLNMSHADYDNDGDVDFIILRGGWLGDAGAEPPSLLRNRGDGTFEDVTVEAGLFALHPGQVGVWADFDNDGWLDLFLGHEDGGAGRHPSLLYRNDGDGTFTECAAACGLANLGFVKGAAWGDYDNDRRPDLYISSIGRPNMLFRNEGPGPSAAAATPEAPGAFSWRFRDVTAQAGVAEPRFSFSSWFFDYDNDGWLDLFVAGFKLSPVADVAALYLGRPHSGETPRLYRNNRDGTFSDVTREAKLDRVLLVMGSSFGDLDNDGFLDLYLGTGAPDLSVLMPNRMFRNNGGTFFEDVTTSGGFGHLQKGHGVAFGDVDDDGDQDVYIVMGGWYSADGFHNCLFENPGHGNHWITLRLQGVRTNRSGVGARIKVTHGEGPSRRATYATLGMGSSFGSAALRPTIGLGRSTTIESIEVLWPATGKTQVLKNIKVDQVVPIREQ